MDSCLESDTATPLSARPNTIPVPSVARTVLAVTAPSNSETARSLTVADRHVEPCTLEESKLSTDPRDVSYADGPRVEARVEAGMPSATTGREGRTSASTPAPTHPPRNEEDASGAYDGAVVVAVVVVVVVSVVVVVPVVPVVVVSVVVVSAVVVVCVDDVVVAVPAARATPTPRKAAATPRASSPTPTPLRIATVCRSLDPSADIDPRTAGTKPVQPVARRPAAPRESRSTTFAGGAGSGASASGRSA